MLTPIAQLFHLFSPTFSSSSKQLLAFLLGGKAFSYHSLTQMFKISLFSPERQDASLNMFLCSIFT